LDDLRDHTAALNGSDSNTGMNLLRHAVAPLATNGRFFGSVVTTGGHLASMEAVRSGATDIAAVDCVTFELADIHRPDLTEGLYVLARTASSPTLPFITRLSASPEEAETLRAALNEVLAEAEPGSAIERTRLRRVERATLADYSVLSRYATEAAAAGYPVLR
jgi:ABC-type phosphate/phosphonate transport system substrate-binding protein